jgi:hypothetical protein
MSTVKKLTQEDLDKMTSQQVLSISLEQIPDGFDIESDGGENAKLIPIDGYVENGSFDEEEKPAETEPVESPEPIVDEKLLPEKKTPSRPPDEKNTGILFIRMFSKDDANGKILTRLKGKVYFPKDPTIKPGWYVACVIEEFERHGVMDTVAPEEISPNLWNSKYIKGIHIKRNYRDNRIEIYPSVPKEKLATEQPPCIHSIPVSDKASGNQIQNILEQKQAEALKDIK